MEETKNGDNQESGSEKPQQKPKPKYKGPRPLMSIRGGRGSSQFMVSEYG